MTIWLASGNKHKQQELSAILNGHTVKIPAEAGISGFNPEETGTSFIENALIKAKALYSRLSVPVLADDSGLCVDALEGRPGIYSSRYYGKTGISAKLSDGERNLLLLEELGNTALRKCRFICAMVLLFSPNRFYLVQETMEGEIVSSAEEIRGSGGFGYDPIVYSPELGRTVAELFEEEKNRLSHRGKAGKAIAGFLQAAMDVTIDKR